MMTMNMVTPALALAGLLALGACAEGTERDRQIRAPAAEVIGEPVTCINTNRIRNTRVHDDFTIDFVMTGNEIFRNTLPNRCSQLGFNQRFAHRSSTGRLCSTDLITVIQPGSSANGPRCGLGQFVPIRLLDPAENAAADAEETSGS